LLRTRQNRAQFSTKKNHADGQLMPEINQGKTKSASAIISCLRAGWERGDSGPSGSSHLLQEAHMGNNGMAHLRVFDVRNAILGAGVFNDAPEVAVMHMGNFGKEVMLDLEIEAAHQPADEFIPGRKISRGLQLVDRPFIFQPACLFMRHGEMRMLYGMSQLENDAEHEAGNQRKDEEAGEPGNEAQDIDRHGHKNKEIKKLEAPEHEVI